MINKYGKKNIHEIKKTFKDNNNEMVLRDSKVFAEIKNFGLIKQCLVCHHNLEKVFFVKHELNYYSCENCGALGIGTPENFLEFFDLLYGNDEYGDYSKFTNERIKQIYVPKVEFLLEVLPNLKENEYRTNKE